MGKRRLKLEDQRFGKLVAKEYVDEAENKRKWRCLCDCGNYCFKSTSELRSGSGVSCGCSKITHKMSNERIYRIWYDMRRRCNSENRKCFSNYGGRGITYDPTWNSFEVFYRDMGETYSETSSLERKDVNENYCKENCEWIELKDQSLNKRKYKSNTVGVAGITRGAKNGIPYLRARVQNPETGKRISKTMFTSVYAEDYILKILNDWLKQKRKEFGYKESHGT